MKKELKGYEIIFVQRVDEHLFLTVDEGRKLQQLLVNKSPRFIQLKNRDLVIRAGTIDYLRPLYKKIEEKCEMCGNAKLINGKCLSCEERVSPFGKALSKNLKEMPNVMKEEEIIGRCKACDVMISGGSYCKDCKKANEEY